MQNTQKKYRKLVVIHSTPNGMNKSGYVYIWVIFHIGNIRFLGKSARFLSVTSKKMSSKTKPSKQTKHK